MADILIQGMKMPKDGCKSCGFDILGICLIKANMDKPYEVTHSCPLIELPPHGRLIDADAFLAKLKNDPLFPLVEQYGMSGVIEAQPTIILADGGEQHG